MQGRCACGPAPCFYDIDLSVRRPVGLQASRHCLVRVLAEPPRRPNPVAGWHVEDLEGEDAARKGDRRVEPAGGHIPRPGVLYVWEEILTLELGARRSYEKAAASCHRHGLVELQGVAIIHSTSSRVCRGAVRHPESPGAFGRDHTAESVGWGRRGGATARRSGTRRWVSATWWPQEDPCDHSHQDRDQCGDQ